LPDEWDKIREFSVQDRNGVAKIGRIDRRSRAISLPAPASIADLHNFAIDAGYQDSIRN
jgi:hypothetical protein